VAERKFHGCPSFFTPSELELMPKSIDRGKHSEKNDLPVHQQMSWGNKSAKGQDANPTPDH
jgi:hypothetical protein